MQINKITRKVFETFKSFLFFSGDLAYFTTILGKENISGYWCPQFFNILINDKVYLELVRIALCKTYKIITKKQHKQVIDNKKLSAYDIKRVTSMSKLTKV